MMFLAHCAFSNILESAVDETHQSGTAVLKRDHRRRQDSDN